MQLEFNVLQSGYQSDHYTEGLSNKIIKTHHQNFYQSPAWSWSSKAHLICGDKSRLSFVKLENDLFVLENPPQIALHQVVIQSMIDPSPTLSKACCHVQESCELRKYIFMRELQKELPESFVRRLEP